MKVWVLSTCLPGENEPCMPQVLVSQEEADAAFATAMDGEWAANTPFDCDGHPLPYPGDPHKAHAKMAEDAEWGRWEITTHNIDLPKNCSEDQLEAAAQALADDVWHPPLPLANMNPSDARRFRRQAEIAIRAFRGKPIFIPENEYEVKPGYYTRPDIVRLLRKHHTNPKAVHFIADMME
jgi:hypothetical protein